MLIQIHSFRTSYRFCGPHGGDRICKNLYRWWSKFVETILLETQFSTITLFTSFLRPEGLEEITKYVFPEYISN